MTATMLAEDSRNPSLNKAVLSAEEFANSTNVLEGSTAIGTWLLLATMELIGSLDDDEVSYEFA